MNKKIKLIKEYPNSQKLGSIFEFNDNHGLYGCDGYYHTTWTKEYFEKWIGVYFEYVS